MLYMLGWGLAAIGLVLVVQNGLEGKARRVATVAGVVVTLLFGAWVTQHWYLNSPVEFHRPPQ